MEAEAHVHAGGEADLGQVAELVAGHLLQGRGLEESLAAEFAAVEEHLVELAEIFGA